MARDVDTRSDGSLSEHWVAAWTGAAAFSACCTPDVHYEDPVAIEPLSGLHELTGHAERLRAAFPDLRIERTADPIETADFACLPWRALGTHRGDLGALPATERFVILHGVHYVELSDGLVRRARGFFDLYSGAVQLGLLPQRGGLGETALLLLRGFGIRPRG
jgi:steroid delta-isomerase-like uncharacterized protein